MLEPRKLKMCCLIYACMHVKEGGDFLMNSNTINNAHATPIQAHLFYINTLIYKDLRYVDIQGVPRLVCQL